MLCVPKEDEEEEEQQQTSKSPKARRGSVAQMADTFGDNPAGALPWYKSFVQVEATEEQVSCTPGGVGYGCSRSYIAVSDQLTQVKAPLQPIHSKHPSFPLDLAGSGANVR